jgi:hypothetical protein
MTNMMKVLAAASLCIGILSLGITRAPTLNLPCPGRAYGLFLWHDLDGSPSWWLQVGYVFDADSSGWRNIYCREPDTSAALGYSCGNAIPFLPGD